MNKEGISAEIFHDTLKPLVEGHHRQSLACQRTSMKNPYRQYQGFVEEMNLQVNDEAEEALLEDEDNTDETMFENERCGICTDIVIDRGVLDCCHHWFCFMCIDNWAAITNLCPLCKKEFQLITCLPVYDTIGGLQNEEHPLSRDDDWRIQGKNNTLSFPSYYIDEDAVLCLDGDGCKIRKGTATVEQDLTFDTSIACDSCDIWYHSFCVGFNPECTSEGSWLCPRCITDAAQPKSDGTVMQNPEKCSAPRSSEFGWTVDPSFSGKVSISVADDGETAVVVSMVEAEQTKATTTSLSEVGRDLDMYKEIGTSLLDNDSGNAKPDVQLKNGGCVELARNGLICSDGKWSNASTTEIENNSDFFFDIAPEMAVNSPEAEPSEKSLVLPCLEDAGSEMTIGQHTDALKTTVALSTSQDVAVSCYSAACNDLEATKTETRGCHPSNSDELKISSPLPYDTSKPKNELCGNNCPNKLNIGLSVPTFSSAGKLADDDTGSHVAADGMTQRSDRSLSEDKKHTNTDEDSVTQLTDSEVGGLMGKCTNKILSNVMNAGCVKNSKKRKLDADHSVNEAKSDGKSQILPSESEVNTSVPEYSQKCSGMTAANNNESLRFPAINKASTPDIMSIVQEIDRRSENLPGGTKFEDKLERKDSSAGLRVKKIMRRVGDKKESSILVQKLRKEIKEAVQDKTLNNIVKDSDSDGRLLRAFRAAIIKPTNEPVGKFDPSIIGAKKSLLQKGKTRESLAKKIYGTSSGRRRRAWDRDWEIEFWKHRCKRVGTENVETLQSVLELLRKATNSCSNNTEMDQESEGEATNSILSRVYPADASVFPRKDNIKPLSALTGCCPIDELKKEKSLNNLAEKEPQTVHASNMAGNPTGISKKTPEVISSDSRVRQVNNTSFTGSVSCGKENIDGRVAISESNTSRGRVQHSKETASQSDTPKSDKRKWALEVLARKNALTNTSASKGKQEDKAALKGNYPLLAQLPTDMRPVPAPSCHNKVSVSVRQAQLYRITEYYLRKTNLPVVCRTADTELAVADAVNVEKEIFERSNSKLVYINLCSQALSQHYRNIQPAETVASLPTTAEEGGDRIGETTLDSSPKRWSNVEEALKLAGLSSDSPPNSPSRTNKDPSEEGNPEGDAREEDLENVLDMDIHPELDIYGDFKYDLENEGYISSFAMGSALGASKVSDQQKGDSRMKVVLSTARCTESDSILESKHDSLQPHSPDNKAAGSGDDNLSDKLIGTGNEPKNLSTNTPILPKLSEEETYMEPSLTECEELYGPDKEFSIPKISDELIGKLNESMEMEAVASKELHGTKMEHVVNKTSDGSNTIEMGASASDGTASFNHRGEDSPAQSRINENAPYEGRMRSTTNKSPDPASSVSKKVEAYIKAHIRPLCISRVITVEQYRWAVGKTTDKVMKFHHKAKNANFLIKEGEKVKKLAEQYVEAAQQI